MPHVQEATVLVAIPREDDYVWKVSSQKIPHMTLLYFGQPGWTPEQLLHVTEYVEHATSFQRRFGMSVERRGTLGPEGEQQADVLFFEKERVYKRLFEFRDNLLAERNMHEAFLKAEQFPEWTPHLTLGYPDSPAKPDTRDYGIGWVEFDQIALWTGDFEGPTFRLKSWDWDAEVSMSAIATGRGTVSGLLSHYGVKGQKWGVRKKRGPSGGSKKRTTFKKAPNKLSTEELTSRIKRMEIERKYNDLNRGDKSDGKKLVEDILSSTGRRVATTVLTGASLVAIRTALTSRFGEAVAGEVTRRLK